LAREKTRFLSQSVGPSSSSSHAASPRRPGLRLVPSRLAGPSASDAGSGRSRLITQTRVATTDAAAERAFARYWRLIYPGSALFRVMWLRAIKARAEGG